MQSLERLRLAVALFVFTACCLVAGFARAYAGAVTNGSSGDGTPGYVTSGVFGADSATDSTPADQNGGCTECHTPTNNQATVITLSTPASSQSLTAGGSPIFTVKHGSTTTFTLTFTNPTGKTGGGFLVMHNDTSASNNNGTLSKVPGDTTVHQCTGAGSGSGSTTCNPTLNSNTEVMHEIPKANGTGRDISFDFRYSANGTVACKTVAFGIWINSVNLDNLCFTAADYPVFREFRITANCDDANGCTTDACNGASCTNTDNGNACNDGNSCTTGDACSGGGCSGSPIICSPLDQCHSAGTCISGVCSNPAKPNGTVCNDGNPCTTGDACTGGNCAGTAIPCPPSDNCHSAGTCAGGVCSNPMKANGAVCDDGQDCTSGDMCSGGVCVGGAIGCTALDQCHNAGSCSGGVCSNPIKPNGTNCNDGDPCTTGDSCSSGTCTGTAMVCPAPDQCHNEGTCSGGVCSNPPKANGSPCNDSKACTTPDTCTAGVCGGAARVCNDGIACTIDGCTEAAGGCTVDASQCGCTKDADCDDHNACTGTETCNLGTLTCVPGKSVDCSGMTDACNTGTCTPATGACTQVPKADGLGCNDGDACTVSDACKAGKCAGSPLPCTASDSCHTAGKCSGGVCSNPSKADGATCDDGNPCTTGETCASGTCRGGGATICNDGNICTVDSCNPSTGCAAAPGNSGTQCSPPSCSGGKETHASVCNGGSASCPAPVGKDCAPYACGATACLADCKVDTDCATGNYCAAGGKCTLKITAGGACTAGTQCGTSFCVDGVCCNDDCVGQCEACNLPNQLGTCSAVTGKPVLPRTACIGNGTGCDGACDGVLTTACTVPGQSKQCRGASCNAASAVATLPEFCDGSGKCPTARTQACAPGVCGATQCTGCSTNAECPTGDFCRGGVCKPQSTPGSKCSIDVECASGHCVDGVCCDTDCAGQCEACNQDGAIGKCTTIPAGQPPAEGRPGCAGKDTQCGGVCDGTVTRSCTYPGPGVQCREGSCKSGSATLVAFCDGAGSCPPPSEKACPANSACLGDLCGGASDSCTSDGDCNSNEYCAGGVCTPKKIPGTDCNVAAECASGTCIDGVCCTKACTGQCEACNAEGHEGTCIPITGSPRGSRQACSSDGTVCGGSCDGVTADRCAYQGPTTQCRPGTCKNDLADLAAYCQGNGSCAPLQQQSCDTTGCNAAAVQCAGACDNNKACPGGQYCSAGICIKVLENGLTCGAAAQCKNGNCVDGVCCDTACTGSCEACDQPGNLGTCVAVHGLPRNGRAACNGSGACGGFCDGVSTCAFPSNSTNCGISFCANGVSANAPACNGSATCIVPSPSSCDPYQCDPNGQACLTTCQLDADCATGLVCLNGGCTQPVPDGGVVDGGTHDGGTTTGAGGAGNSAGGGGTAGTGTAGTAGRAGSGNGTGGATVSVDGGLAPDASDAGSGHRPGAGSGDSGGCNCRTAALADRGGSNAALAALAGLALFAARRRRGAPRVAP